MLKNLIAEYYCSRRISSGDNFSALCMNINFGACVCHPTQKDLKKYIVDIHKKGSIEHLKLDKNDCNEVSEKVYGSDKI